MVCVHVDYAAAGETIDLNVAGNFKISTIKSMLSSKQFGQPITHINNNGATSGFDMCLGPSILGAGGKSRLEVSIKKFKPHFIYNCLFRPPSALAEAYVQRP